MGREWVGIDISSKAAELIGTRMQTELGVMYNGVHREDVPVRTDLGKTPKYNSIENKKTLYGEQEGRCNGCETLFEMRNLTVDHIVPKSKGGHDHLSNLQLLCGACNSLKGTKTHEELLWLLSIVADGASKNKPKPPRGNMEKKMRFDWRVEKPRQRQGKRFVCHELLVDGKLTELYVEQAWNGWKYGGTYWSEDVKDWREGRKKLIEYYKQTQKEYVAFLEKELSSRPPAVVNDARRALFRGYGK